MPDDAYFEAADAQREVRAGSRKEPATSATSDEPAASHRDGARQATQTIHDHDNEGGLHE